MDGDGSVASSQLGAVELLELAGATPEEIAAVLAAGLVRPPQSVRPAAVNRSVYALRPAVSSPLFAADSQRGSRRPDREVLVSWYVTEGVDEWEIARRCEVTMAAVLTWLARAGIARRPPTRHIVDWDLVVDLHHTGLDPAGIAEQVDASPGRVRAFLRDRDLLPVRRWVSPDPADVARLHNEGLHPTQIAAQLNCSAETVYRRLRTIRTPKAPSGQ